MTGPASTVRLHRVLRAPPERIYRAFVEPDAMAKWIRDEAQRFIRAHAERRDGATPAAIQAPTVSSP